MQVDSELIRLLMEIGYLSGGHGMFSQSKKIFEGICAARPKSEYPLIGLSVTLMNAGLHEEAISVLEEAQKLNPENFLTKSFLGLALKLSGQESRSRVVLSEVLENVKEGEAFNMAKALLEEMS